MRYDMTIVTNMKTRAGCRFSRLKECVSSSFLYNGTQSLFESCGFRVVRNKGKNHVIMRLTVERA